MIYSVSASKGFGYIEHSMEEFRPLLDLVDDLRQLQLSPIIFSLPRIVVVGDQSAGKSSVLQSIANVELPQGGGAVTRCPLILRMQNIKATDTSVTISWPGQSAKMLNDVKEIVKEVASATKILTKFNDKEFSDQEIQLTIKGPNCPDLTLVDLPGIVRNTKEQQDASVVTKIKTMIRKQIAQKESIIAAVIACGDLETSEALAMAKEVDPKKERTIGILTKPDLQDPGTDMSQVLEGREHRLQNGYIVVKNRGQQQVAGNQAWEDARDDERAFFEGHPVYSRMDPSFFGACNLVKKMQPLLKEYILKHIPGIRKQVQSELEKSEAELLTLISEVPTDTSAKLIMAIQLAEKLKFALTHAIVSERTDIEQSDQVEEASVQIRRLQENFAVQIHKIYLSCIGAGISESESLFVRFAFNDMQIDRPAVDHSYFYNTIVPCLALERSAVKLVKISSITDTEINTFLVTGCSQNSINQQYHKTQDTYNNEPVFKAKAGNYWLFQSEGTWGISASLGPFRLVKGGFSLKQDFLWAELDSSTYTVWSPNPKLKVQPVSSTWEAVFRISGQSTAKTAVLTSRFFHHIHSFEGRALFASKGLTFMGSVAWPAGCLSERIKTLMKMCKGPEPPGFCSSGPFKSIMRDQIKQFKDPVRKFVEDVYNVVLKCVSNRIRSIFRPVPPFQSIVFQSCQNLVSRLSQEALRNALIEIDKEHDFLFTNNKYFFNTVNSIREARLKSRIALFKDCDLDIALKLASEHGRSNEEEEAQDIQDKVISYSKLVYKRVSDSVPMTVQHHLVAPMAKEIFNSLIETIAFLNSNGYLADHFVEGAATASKREHWKSRVSQLQKAKDILARFREEYVSDENYKQDFELDSEPTDIKSEPSESNEFREQKWWISNSDASQALEGARSKAAPVSSGARKTGDSAAKKKIDAQHVAAPGVISGLGFFQPGPQATAAPSSSPSYCGASTTSSTCNAGSSSPAASYGFGAPSSTGGFAAFGQASGSSGGGGFGPFAFGSAGPTIPRLHYCGVKQDHHHLRAADAIHRNVAGNSKTLSVSSLPFSLSLCLSVSLSLCLSVSLSLCLLPSLPPSLY